MSVRCFQSAIRDGGHSPLARIVCLDWYDGIVSCLAECGACQQTYSASMVAWSADHNVRVYAFAALPQAAYREVVERLSRTAAPAWPVWVPPRSEWLQAGIGNGLLAAAPPFFLIAARRLNETLLACETVEKIGMASPLESLLRKSQQMADTESASLVELSVAVAQSAEDNSHWFAALKLESLVQG